MSERCPLYPQKPTLVERITGLLRPAASASNRVGQRGYYSPREGVVRLFLITGMLAVLGGSAASRVIKFDRDYRRAKVMPASPSDT